MANIIIPTPLRKYSDNKSKFQSQAGTVDEAINELVTTYPDLKKHLMDDKDQLRSFVKVFVGEEDIRDLDKGDTAVKEETTISIVPAIAGGK